MGKAHALDNARSTAKLRDRDVHDLFDVRSRPMALKLCDDLRKLAIAMSPLVAHARAGIVTHAAVPPR